MQTERRRKSRKPETFTLSFRVGPAHLSLLEAQAATCEMSVHEYARKLVIETLEDSERERVRDEVKAVKGEVRKLRDDIATSLETILLNLTKASEDDIRQWVSENLRL